MSVHSKLDTTPSALMSEKQKLHLNVEYTFTINPEAQCNRAKGNTLEMTSRHGRVHYHVKKVLDELASYGVQYYLRMEASEPLNAKPKVAGSRFHYHGIILFPSVESLRDFYEYGTVLLTEMCSYEIDTIGNRDKWMAYVEKQSFLEWKTAYTYDYKPDRASKSKK